MSAKILAASVAAVVLIACGEVPSAPVQLGLGKVEVAQNSFPIAYTTFNPCPPVPESVSLSGTLHLVYKIRGNWVDWRYNFSNVKGVGLTTGNSYVVQDNVDQQSMLLPPAGFTVSTTEHLRVVSMGNADNFDLVFDWTYSTPPPTLTVDKFRFECRG